MTFCPKIFLPLLIFGALLPPISAQSSDSVTVVAGNGEAGFIDGPQARLNKPIRMAPYGPGKILIADISNNAIRIVTKDGHVTTITGGPDKQGHQDGPADQAMLNGPHGVALSQEGIIAVAGASSHMIRLITPSVLADNKTGYMVSSLAGVNGETGFRDGSADQALFNSPHGIVWDNDGGLLVVDIGNAAIRKIKDGQVTTVLTAENTAMSMPIDIAPGLNGSFLIADAGNNSALRWWPLTGKIDIIATDQELKVPHGVAEDRHGAVYVAEIGSHEISRLSKGHREVIVGTGNAGHAENELDKPAAVLVHDGLVWIADLNNHRISVVPVTSKKSVK